MMNTFNQFVQQRGRLIARIVVLLLAVISLFVLAKLIWLWVEFFQPPPEITPVKSTPTPTKQKTVNVERLAAMHLFGEANAPIQEQVEAEETNLNLKLLGTYLSDEKALNSAIIQANGNNEDVYFLNDKLNVRGQVTLHKVESLKVILKNGGKYETLTLIENLNQKILSSAKKPKEKKSGPERTIDKRRDARLSKELAEMKQKLYTNPQAFNDIANIQRVVDSSGQVSGFKVSPGKDPRLFTRLGLRRNDIVTSVNGQPLNEQGYLGILSELNNAQSLEVTIERNGQPVTLLLGISDQSEQRSPAAVPPESDKKREGNVRQIK